MGNVGTTYCIFVTDALGDTASDCMQLTISPYPTLTLAASQICFGDTLHILPPYSHLSQIDWNENGLSNYVPFDSTMPYHVYSNPRVAVVRCLDTLGCENAVWISVSGSKIDAPIDSFLCGNKEKIVCAFMNGVISMNWTGVGIGLMNSNCISLAPNA